MHQDEEDQIDYKPLLVGVGHEIPKLAHDSPLVLLEHSGVVQVVELGDDHPWDRNLALQWVCWVISFQLHA